METLEEDIDRLTKQVELRDTLLTDAVKYMRHGTKCKGTPCGCGFHEWVGRLKVVKGGYNG